MERDAQWLHQIKTYSRSALSLPKVLRLATIEEAEAYDGWFRAKVEKAMASTASRIPHDEVMAMARAVIDKHRRG